MFDLQHLRDLHAEGLERVSAVVDGNASYDELLEYRITEADRAAYAAGVPLEARRNRACSDIRQSLRSRSHKVILPQFEGFVSEGRTANNDREYRFFERLCAPLGIKVQHQNYSDCAAIGMGARSDAEQALLEAVIASAEEFYRLRADISAGLVRQLTLYSVSYFRFAVAFRRKGAKLPGALVQANDHAPVRVAMSMTMKGLGVPRIYLQHAEVTPIFPPLDFEYSVLRNVNSKSVYAAIQRSAGQVFVIPRDSEAFASDDLTAEQPVPVSVVIYPTSRIAAEPLRRTITALKANPLVGKIGIKQHPAAAGQLQQMLSDEGVTFAERFPEERHVALVGNSSVVAELLHRGVPVYQNFDFDPVAADYYGFVAKGLTIAVTQRALSGKFWRPYALSAEWLAAYRQFDPTLDPTFHDDENQFLAEMQRLRSAFPTGQPNRSMRGRVRARVKSTAKRSVVALLNAMPRAAAPLFDAMLSTTSRFGSFLTLYSFHASNYLRNRTAISTKSAQWTGTKAPSGPRLNTAAAVPLLELTLRDSGDPAGWVAANDQLGVFSDELVIRAFENLFQDRSAELSRIYDGFDVWPENSAIGTWIYLKRAEWGNISLEEAELDRVSAFIHGLGSGFVRSLLERSLLAVLIRCGTAEQLDGFWSNAPGFSIVSIATNTKIALLQKLYAQPDRVAQAIQLRDRFEQSSSPLELLKLRNMDYLSGRQSPGWSHEMAEQRFAEAAPRGVAREFADVAQPFYARFRDRMVFMEARNDAAQAQSIVDRIRQSLQQKSAFSLIRLSDGEGYLFPDLPHFTEEDARNRERHWWGTELPPELGATIIAAARAAVATADILGIPSVYRFIRDTGDTARSLSHSLQGRGLLQVLAGLPSSMTDAAQLSEDKVNLALFRELGTVLSLAADARHVYVIGSVQTAHLPASLTNLPNAEFIVIPTHARTLLNERYEPGDLALPFVYEQFLERQQNVGPGDLVLVAGGIIGKILLGRARDRGAVALDIGSVIDEWASDDQASVR